MAPIPVIVFHKKNNLQMNKEACTIIFIVELFLITKIRYHLNVNEHGKLIIDFSIYSYLKHVEGVHIYGIFMYIQLSCRK